MAITWNATTKKWTLVGTCSAAGAALLVWAGVAIGNANSNANEAKGVAGAAMGQVKSVEGAVEALDAEVDLVYEAVEQAQRTADNALKEVKVHRDSTIAQGVHQAAKKPAAKPVAKKEAKVVAPKKEVKMVEEDVLAQDVQITFKKNLTPREQAVFEHFLNNKNQIVYAKELAQVLELPRDYVYKYIKNLRAKMNENAIQNADNGGFVLEVK